MNVHRLQSKNFLGIQAIGFVLMNANWCCFVGKGNALCMHNVFAFSLNFWEWVLFLSLSLSESPEGIRAFNSSENGELWLPSKCEGRQGRQTPQCPQTLRQQVHGGMWVLLLLRRDGYRKVRNKYQQRSSVQSTKYKEQCVGFSGN